MFSKDPKKPSIDPIASIQDEVINQAKDALISQASAKTQQAINAAQTALSVASNMTSRLDGVSAALTPGGGFTGGLQGAISSETGAYSEMADKAQSTLLSALGLNPDPSGLVFTCEIGLLPPGTLQVTDFSLTEGLSSLFSLSINAVSLLPVIDFQEHLGQVSSLTVKRDGKVVRTVKVFLQGLLKVIPME